MALDVDPDLSPYLRGNYAPVADELDVADLEVTGEIPAALRGAYLRNGPNPAFVPIGKYHVFDGDGMVHAVELADGRARYRNRWIASRGLAAERAAGHALYGGLSNWVMPDPATIEAGGLMKNTANTNVVRHAGRILALMEGAPPTELTRELDTVGEYDFDGRLVGAMTAHPKWDPATGELLFFGYSPFPPFLRYHVVDRAGTLVRSVDLDLPAPVMMHDFVVTDRHVVFFDLPAVFDAMAMMNGGDFISWRPDNGARIGILPRDGGSDDVRWIEVDPFYVFHFLNAWDTPTGEVVVDGCRAWRMPTAFGDEELTEAVVPTLHRWTIDPAAGAVTTEQLDDRAAEFPRLNMHRAGVENRYGYLGDATVWETTAVQFTGIVKYDLEAGSSIVHHFGDRCEGGEPVFAPDPDGTAEDDGWLMTFVYDRDTDASHLRIVDARDPSAPPVAQVHLPRRIPTGFHGNWLPDGGALPTN